MQTNHGTGFLYSSCLFILFYDVHFFQEKHFFFVMALHYKLCHNQHNKLYFQ